MLNEKTLNPTIAWLAENAKTIRNTFSRFYNDKDKTRIRFNFGENPYCYTFAIKFTPSHRILKFIVSKDPDAENIVCHLLEKTDNIILDIDLLYKCRDTKHIALVDMTNRDIHHELTALWYWGCLMHPDHGNGIHKASALWFQTDGKRNDALYVAIITDVKVFPKQTVLSDEITSKDICRVQLQLSTASDRQYHDIEATEGIAKTIYPGQLFVCNWMDRFSIMNFARAKHHLIFTPDQYAHINEHTMKYSIKENPLGKDTENPDPNTGSTCKS